MNYIKKARQVFDHEISALKKVRDALSASFTDTVSLALKTIENKGKIVVTGVGKSLHIAQKISATLASTGTTSVVLNPSQAMHGDLGILTPADVLLAISYSGESEELLSLLPQVKRQGIPVVCITGSEDNALARNSDIVIVAAVDREACPFNMVPTASTTAALALGDALAMVLLDARGFGKEDYARLHPGGAIGRALLLRISDIMRTDDRVAKVKTNAKVRDALVSMTRARAGSAAVLDEKNRVVGIFTDGDLRRHLADTNDILNMSIDAVMTASPITVTGDHLAAEVLKVYEEHNIDDVLVVDRKGCLIGAVDIQDLPKLKIL